MNTSHQSSWQCYARVNYYFCKKVKKCHEHVSLRLVKTPAHPWRKSILIQGKGRAGGGEGEEKHKDNQNVAKRGFKRFLNIFWLFMTETGAPIQPMEFRAKLVAKEKRDGSTKKSLNVFGTFFLIFSLVTSFMPARDHRRCRLAGVTYCFSNIKFLPFGWQTGKFSKLTKKIVIWLRNEFSVK